MHFYYLPLTTEWHIYLTNRLLISCANHGLHLICVSHSRHQVIDYTKVKGVNKQSQTEEDIKMFFFIDKDIFISPFDPMKIMIHLYFCSRYIMYLQLTCSLTVICDIFLQNPYSKVTLGIQYLAQTRNSRGEVCTCLCISINRLRHKKHRSGFVLLLCNRRELKK